MANKPIIICGNSFDEKIATAKAETSGQEEILIILIW